MPGGRRKAGLLLREASGNPAEHLFPPLPPGQYYGIGQCESTSFYVLASRDPLLLPPWSTFGLGWLVMRHLAAGWGRSDVYNYNRFRDCDHGRGERHRRAAWALGLEDSFQAPGPCALVQVSVLGVTRVKTVSI